MENKTDAKVERVLSLVEPGRREALRKILTTAAYAAPVIASFSMDAGAGPAFCFASNQTCSLTEVFFGTVKCKGLSFDGSPGSLAHNVNLSFDVQINLSECPAGSTGLIIGGPSTLVPASGVTFAASLFPGKNNDTLGFSVQECAFAETGQWTLEPKKDGKDKLTGDSYVVIAGNSITAPTVVSGPSLLGTSYTLQCEYELTKAPPV
jgi:hypothetical protein